jgi:hypothetical protein
MHIMCTGLPTAHTPTTPTSHKALNPAPPRPPPRPTPTPPPLIPQVIEPTLIAALNMSYPASKLTVHVLDDGRKPDVADLVQKLRGQAKAVGRTVNLVYTAREKTSGVAHHAKAGNINSALLRDCRARGVFVLVLDCDMIVHPDFLLRTLGHFYQEGYDVEAAGLLDADGFPAKAGSGWRLKDKAAFLQTPQDFWNVERGDPLGHCARFFYGPMLQVGDWGAAVVWWQWSCCWLYMLSCVMTTAQSMADDTASTTADTTAVSACCRVATALVPPLAAALVSSSGVTSWCPLVARRTALSRRITTVPCTSCLLALPPCTSTSASCSAWRPPASRVSGLLPVSLPVCSCCAAAGCIAVRHPCASAPDGSAAKQYRNRPAP